MPAPKMKMISWNTTNLCNLSCPHCYRNSGPRSEGELTTAEAKGLLREIKAAGFLMLVFSGGEPLLREDLGELIAAARSLGIRPVLGSNGTLLTASKAQELKEAGIAAVSISLDSTDPARHDSFRGHEGAWRRAVEGIEHCRREGIPVQVNTTVFPWNYREILDISQLAVKLGAGGHHVFFYVPTGRGKEKKEPSISAEETEELLIALVKARQQFPLNIKPTCAPQFIRVAKELKIPLPYSRGCLAGISYCIIGTAGEVRPCPYLDLTVGNIRQTPFSTIWRESEVLRELRRETYSGYCGICAYRRLCGGCRARVYARGAGDLLAQDNDCLYGQKKARQLAPLAEKVIFRLQEGLPLVERPYLALAEELGVKEGEVIRAIRWLKAIGVIRRLGASFDSERLGYRGTLCAMKVPPERIEEVAAVINAYPGVTHNYLRHFPYNLWFTLNAGSNGELERLLGQIRDKTKIADLVSLPAETIFKLEVKFDKGEIEGAFTKGKRTDPGLAG